MKLSSSHFGNAMVICPRDAIVQGECELLRTAVDEAMLSGRGCVVVDLSEVPFIDSAGLELLCDLLDVAAERGHALKLAAASEVCQEILRITNLADHFGMYASIEDAARSLVP